MVRVGLRNMLQADPLTQVVGEARDGAEALNLVRTMMPEILLLDLAMPRMPGMEALRELTSQITNTRTIVLTGLIESAKFWRRSSWGPWRSAERCCRRTLGRLHPRCNPGPILAGWTAGTKPGAGAARSYRADPPPPRKTFGLTARELEVVTQITEGCTNKDIAQSFGISEETVKRHLTNIFNKLGVGNRLELALFALNHHLLPPEPADVSPAV